MEKNMPRTASRVSTIVGGTVLIPTLFAASIAGSVVDTTNHPIAAAIVTISGGGASRTTPPTMHGAATQTASDGTFSFTNLDAGTYLVCAQVPKGTLLNPCQSTRTPPLVIITSSTATAAITLTMLPGYRLPSASTTGKAC